MSIAICMRNVTAGIVLLSIATYLFLIFFVCFLRPVSGEIKMYILTVM